MEAKTERLIRKAERDCRNSDQRIGQALVNNAPLEAVAHVVGTIDDPWEIDDWTHPAVRKFIYLMDLTVQAKILGMTLAEMLHNERL